MSILTELISNEAETQSPCLTPYSFSYRVTLPANDANGDCENELVYSYVHPFYLFVHLFIKHLLSTYMF